MGTEIDLTIAGVTIDWSKNHMGVDHGFNPGVAQHRSPAFLPFEPPKRARRIFLNTTDSFGSVLFENLRIAPMISCSFSENSPTISLKSFTVFFIAVLGERQDE